MTSTAAEHRRPLVLLATLAALLALLGAASPALADRTADVSIMDDQLLLNGSQENVNEQMQIFQRLGVDRIRVSAFWSQIAPAPDSTVKPANFNAADPQAPGYNWAALDRVVAAASAYGFKIMVSISTPAPLWATGNPALRNPVWKPRAGDFADFAEAVTRRYAPLVDHWGVSNEPNQPQWLQPQTENGKLAAPHIYRAMVQAAYPRIKAFDPTSLVLIGELSALGSRANGIRRPVKPLRFLRAMGCRDARYRRMRSGPCRGFTAVPGDAIGHHPYQLFFDPSVGSQSRDDAQLGDGLRILRVVDRLQRLKALRLGVGRRFNLYYTEFGYQTKPPDPFAGIPLGTQSRYLQKAAYIVWRTPRIKELNQFRLTDGAIVGNGRKDFVQFQSGLLFADRRRKPAFSAFAHPFVVSGDRFWGQVRVGSGRYTVRVQRLIGRRYRTVAQVLTDSRGYFSFVLPGRRRGRYRYLYSGGTTSGRSRPLDVRR